MSNFNATRPWLIACVIALVIAGCSSGTSYDQSEQPVAGIPERPLPDVEGKTTFELMVIGDFGAGTGAEHRVADAMQDWHAEFGVDAIVTTGDNIYPDGSPQRFDAAWHEPFGWVEREGLEVIASLGNHDILFDGGVAVMGLFDMPGPYYDVTIGDAEIFVLDANRVSDPKQLGWLKRQLARSDTAWQIAAFHQPAYSCSRHGSTPEVVEEWVPLFQEFGLDLALSGHDHLYQRFDTEKGVTYVVTGGGGTFLDGVAECPATVPHRAAAIGKKHHFVAIQGSADELSLRAIGLEQPTLDEFSLRPTNE